MPKMNGEREAKRQRQAQLLAAMQEMGVTDVAGVQALFKEMVGTVLSAGLEGELEEELGYAQRRADREESGAHRHRGTDGRHPGRFWRCGSAKTTAQSSG